jgi:protein SCO1/2
VKRALAVTIVAVCACSSGPRESPHVAAPAPAQNVTGPSRRLAEPLPAGPSIYDLTITLRASDDRSIPLDVDRGHPTLISMFYGSCAMACPALIGYLRQVMATAPSDTRVLLVSFDAARDTPEHLRSLVATHRLDARWTLASASPADARTLAAVLGTKYRSTPRGEFIHNTVIVALDGDGQPIAKLTGIGDNTAFDQVLLTANPVADRDVTGNSTSRRRAPNPL